ncbi:MAG: tRNA (N6-isopentenyl adenosine(37)-C2)-methylthiotransferase MiaB [Bacteroidales bacterium]|nr:tRNA (N6-isopentenyl adenosine(37)-C2)-methylthiotransferase MiaB [Bacteroidales bacterium]MBS3774236.1 tRNA (N6-isopentenyl adenosine(37)-C2)-methylthiotransferase MiaB [Bacteroidales bacterium]
MSASKPKKFYIETYGCQMNVADSEVVKSIMNEEGYELTQNMTQADVILVNTCSIRENAEQRVWGRLNVFRQMKEQKPDIKVGVIGCMAERLKEKLIDREKSVDLILGPDAYRSLPNILETVDSGQKGVNTILSREETYGDIAPVRTDKNNLSAFISIMRGCNNMCSYCIVPFVRGRERSRDPETIYSEVHDLSQKGYREITLIGQNVDSYKWKHEEGTQRFAELLEQVAGIDPEMRIRFATSHPKDLSDQVLKTMANHPNICKHIHLPVQSGSTKILKAMNRGYTREWYLNRIDAIRRYLPDAEITTDIMAGFCTETEEDHKATLSLMEYVNYDFAYMFKYSERPGTRAARKMEDDVPEDTKKRRLNEIIELQNQIGSVNKKKSTGNNFTVLVEGTSKKSNDEYFGRNSQNQVVVFPKDGLKPGDFAKIRIEDSTPATLRGKVIED